jgi:hypothetical protein
VLRRRGIVAACAAALVLFGGAVAVGKSGGKAPAAKPAALKQPAVVAGAPASPSLPRIGAAPAIPPLGRKAKPTPTPVATVVSTPGPTPFPTAVPTTTPPPPPPRPTATPGDIIE